MHSCLTPQPYENGSAAEGTTVLVIGGGPCGLRMAIECLLLGCRVVVVEKRRSYSRNNVLHLWPFTITDLKRLGAKKFYGKFCAGSLDHISEWAWLGAWLGVSAAVYLLWWAGTVRGDGHTNTHHMWLLA